MAAMVTRGETVLGENRGMKILLSLLTLCCCSSEVSFEWKGASDSNKVYAVGDPPPRPPRLPPNSTCAFGNEVMECTTAHNYFHDFDPIETAEGIVALWNDDGCAMKSSGATFVLKNGERGPERKHVGFDRTDPSAPQSPQKVVVFVKRGGCAFATKVQTILATSSHASVVAVVFIDLPNSLQLLEPGLGETKGIDIPVVMISHQSALRVIPTVDLASSETSFNGIVSEMDALHGSIVVSSTTFDALRGKGSCQCAVESPEVMTKFHFMHREGLKERLDFIVDEGKRALMSFSHVRTLKMMKYYAHQIPAYSTVGVSQAVLDDFVQEVLPLFRGPIILVTTDYNSDRSSPKPFHTDHSHLLYSPAHVYHWFSDNWAVTSRLKIHDRLTLMPIGINDRHVPKSHGDRRLLLQAVTMVSDNSIRPARAMANFQHSQSLGWWDEPASGLCCDRKEAWEVLGAASSNSTCTVKDATGERSCVEDTTQGEMIDFLGQSEPFETWLRHSDYAFEVCPQGNGVDTHRTWEALLLKTIPIVKSSSLDPLYEGLPVVIVSDWRELVGESGAANLLRWHSELSHLFEGSHGEELKRRLTVEYWVDRIKEKQRQALAISPSKTRD